MKEKEKATEEKFLTWQCLFGHRLFWNFSFSLITRQSGFHLSVEKYWFCINYSTWLAKKNSRHFLIQSEVKPKPIVTRSHSFSRTFSELQVITSSFDWFTVLTVSFWLARVITLVLILQHSIENCSICGFLLDKPNVNCGLLWSHGACAMGMPAHITVYLLPFALWTY